MSAPRKDGGPAFPYAFEHDGHANISGFAPGMSLRDWFAGQALQSYLAGRNLDHRESDPAVVAAGCWKYADAMLATRGPKEAAP